MKTDTPKVFWVANHESEVRFEKFKMANSIESKIHLISIEISLNPLVSFVSLKRWMNKYLRLEDC